VVEEDGGVEEATVNASVIDVANNAWHLCYVKGDKKVVAVGAVKPESCGHGGLWGDFE